MNENNSKINASLFQCWICESEIELVDNKIMNQLSYEVSTDKIESLGFVFKDNLGDGIEQTISLLRNSN